MGGADGGFSEVAGWLSWATVEESTKTEVADIGLIVQSSIKGSLHLHSFSDELLLPDTTLASIIWSSTDGSADAATMGESSNLEQWRLALSTTSLEDILADLSRLTSAGKADSRELYEALEKLSWLVRIDPAVCDRIRNMLLNAEVPEDIAIFVLGALGAANSEKAGETLQRILADSGMSEGIRIGAAQSMCQLQRPSSAAVGTVVSVLQELQVSSPLRGTAALLLGAWASHLNGGVNLDLEFAAGHLLAWHDQARELGLVDVWLEALGNWGSEGIVPEARQYVWDSDEHLRLAAISALRRVDSPEAMGMLALSALQDGSTQVRATAAEILGASSQPEALTAVEYILRSEQDLQVRYSAVQGLISRLPEDVSVLRVLQWVATEDPSVELRRLVAQVINA